MTDEEKKFYRDLYKLFADENINKLLSKYAKMQFDKQLQHSRSKREEYGYGYGNGSMDAWQHVIDMKQYLTKIMREI